MCMPYQELIIILDIYFVLRANNQLETPNTQSPSHTGMSYKYIVK